eukprot:300232-Chlamydomonas_euryale.AAC.4
MVAGVGACYMHSGGKRVDACMVSESGAQAWSAQAWGRMHGERKFGNACMLSKVRGYCIMSSSVETHACEQECGSQAW